MIDREAVTRPDLALTPSRMRRVGLTHLDPVGSTPVYKHVTREVARIADLYSGSPAGWSAQYVGGICVITAYLTIDGVETAIATSADRDQRVAFARLLGMLFEIGA